MRGRKVYLLLPFVLPPRIHSPIWYFQVAQPDCRKVRAFLILSPVLHMIFSGIAVMISHGNVIFTTMQAVVVSQATAEAYKVNSIFVYRVSDIDDILTAPTFRNTRRYPCRAWISTFPPHIWPSLPLLPCFSPAHHPHSPEQMGHRSRTQSHT